MNKSFFALIAALPFFAGCWPFSKKEEAKPEMTESMTSAEETMTDATPSEESMPEDAAHGEEAESDEK